MHMMQSYKAVLFDYDDTLVKTRESKWQAIKETARRFYNLTIQDEDIAIFWGKPFEQMLTGSMKNIDEFERLKEKYFLVTNEFPMEAHEGAANIVNKLLSNYYVGIVTASSQPLVLADLRQLNFPVNNLYAIQTAEDTAFHKPDPRVFDPILSKLKDISIQGQEIVYIGDGVRDYQAARDAGISFIGICHGTTSKEEFEELGATAFDSFAEVAELLLV